MKSNSGWQTEMTEYAPEIAIVGGGLVGLSFAAALKDAGVSVMLIDAAPLATPPERRAPSRTGHVLESGVDARVSAINPSSHDFLCRIGGWPGDDVACAFTRMSVADARGTGHIEFDAGTAGEDALGYIVPNRAVVAALTATLQASPIELRAGTRIDRIASSPEGYELVLADGDVVRCRLLVGADGGNSIVRKACSIRSLSWKYPQEAVVTTIETARDHGSMARQWFTSEGPLAFLPLPEANLSSIVWSSTDAGRLLQLDESALCAALTRASEGALGEVLAVDQRFSFPLRQSHAFEYVRAHLALIGDAAHTIHPLAGQGANLGIADAEVLAQVLIEADFAGESISDVAILRRYQRRRRPLNVATAALMETFARLYNTDVPALNWFRNAAFRVADSREILKSALTRAASGRIGFQ